MPGQGFIESTVAGIICLQHVLLKERGIEHGFLGRGLVPGSADRERMASRFSDLHAGKELRMPHQVHGDVVCENTEAVMCGEADALICELVSPEKSFGRAAYGIRTADCLPILIVGSTSAALVHAGWRGVANGITLKAIALLGERGERSLKLFIGPAAGARQYEVGAEVIDQLGACAVYESAPTPGKYLLNLPGSLERQVKGVAPVLEVFQSGVCTITDTRFASYRRDGGAAERNLMYLIPG